MKTGLSRNIDVRSGGRFYNFLREPWRESREAGDRRAASNAAASVAVLDQASVTETKQPHSAACEPSRLISQTLEEVVGR